MILVLDGKQVFAAGAWCGFVAFFGAVAKLPAYFFDDVVITFGFYFESDVMCKRCITDGVFCFERNGAALALCMPKSALSSPCLRRHAQLM